MHVNKCIKYCTEETRQLKTARDHLMPLQQHLHEGLKRLQTIQFFHEESMMAQEQTCSHRQRAGLRPLYLAYDQLNSPTARAAHPHNSTADTSKRTQGQWYGQSDNRIKWKHNVVLLLGHKNAGQLLQVKNYRKFNYNMVSIPFSRLTFFMHANSGFHEDLG